VVRGVVHDVITALGMSLQVAGNFLLLVGEPRDELTGSAYTRDLLGEPGGAPPSLDLAREARLHELAVLAAEGRWVRAAHDVSDGGLAAALAEMIMACPPERGLGVEVDLGVLEAPAAMALFSERPGSSSRWHPSGRRACSTPPASARCSPGRSARWCRRP